MAAPSTVSRRELTAQNGHGLLIKYEQARTALAACVRVDEAKKIRDQAEALRAYAVQSNDFELETWAAEIKTRAIRRIGEISAKLEKAKAGRKGKGKEIGPPGGLNKSDALAAAGLTKQQASRCEKIASIPKQEFEALLREKKTKQQPVSTKELLKKVPAKVRKKKREDHDRKAAKEAELFLKSADSSGVCHGDSFELSASIPDASCHLIFTDPPYDRDSLPLFSKLSELADRILVDGGSLITFCGQYVLPEVMQRLSERLRYFWICCCAHSGGTAEMREYGIKVKWKPMLWFVKGKFRRDRERWIEDLIASQQEKESHPWQQSVIEARHFIEALSPPKSLIVDPFCGGGTTAVAAKELGRQWWTCDTNAVHVSTTIKRLGECQPSKP